MYNRKQRRDMEKRVGLYRQYSQMSETQKAEVRRKRIMAGKQIHLNNVQKVEEALDNARSERFAKALQNLIASGIEESAAEAMLVRNIELEEERAEKLLARYERQRAAFAKN
jgi:hypothetical protein